MPTAVSLAAVYVMSAALARLALLLTALQGAGVRCWLLGHLGLTRGLLMPAGAATTVAEPLQLIKKGFVSPKRSLWLLHWLYAAPGSRLCQEYGPAASMHGSWSRYHTVMTLIPSNTLLETLYSSRAGLKALRTMLVSLCHHPPCLASSRPVSPHDSVLLS